MYKNIFNRVFNIISSPGKTWDNIIYEQKETKEQEALESPETNKKNKDIIHIFVLPMISFLTLASFLGVLMKQEASLDLSTALKTAIITFISALCGFFCSVYILKKYSYRFFNVEIDDVDCKEFVAYSSTIWYIVAIITFLIPGSFFLKVLYIYTAYVIWEGVVPIFHVTEDDKGGFVLFATSIILLCPILIEILFKLIMPGF